MRTLTHILDKIFTRCCYVTLVTMVFYVTQQVIARFTFSAPSTILNELAQILFMWMILLGGICTVGLERHPTVDSLVQKLPAVSIPAPDSFIQIIITVFAVIFMVHDGNIVVEEAQHVGQISPILEQPVDRVYWAMPVSGLILVWYSVMNIIDNYRERNFH